MRFSLRAMFIVILLIAAMCIPVTFMLRAMREAQMQLLAARRATEVAQVAALKAAKEEELARLAAQTVGTPPVATRNVPPTDLKMLSWNVESDGNQPETIAQQLPALGRFDVYALQEVRPENFERYWESVRDAFGEEFRYVGSSSGFSDRLMLIFDSSRLQLRESSELYVHGETVVNTGVYRSPMVAEFRDMRDGVDFLVMTVHLARGDAEFRAQQAQALREWAAAQTLPILALGDFNMDYVFATERGNPAFDVFLEGGVWTWVRPEPLVDTNWYDGDGDGADDYPGSMLDFVFTCGEGWNVVAGTITREGDFPDDESTSDHRPIFVEVGGRSAAEDGAESE